MMATLNQTGGLIFSQRLLLALVEKGAVRKEAYEHVQKHAMATWEGRGQFQMLIEQDPFIAKHLSRKDIATCFNPKAYVRHQDQIFNRVFGKRGRGGHVRKTTVTNSKNTSIKKVRL